MEHVVQTVLVEYVHGALTKVPAAQAPQLWHTVLVEVVHAVCTNCPTGQMLQGEHTLFAYVLHATLWYWLALHDDGPLHGWHSVSCTPAQARAAYWLTAQLEHGAHVTSCVALHAVT